MLHVAVCVAVACAAVPPAESPKDAPQTILKNDRLRLVVYLPDLEKGYYRGPRFDWSGLVGKVEFKGHTLFGEWKDGHDPANHDDLGGTAEEFGVKTPLGFDDAKPGGIFYKIGIGGLERADGKDYSFARKYKVVKPGEWKVTSGEGWIEYHQDFNADGWGWKYVKRLELADDAPAFTVRRTLINTGEKAIKTDHYCHNFLIFDGAAVGPDYRATFGFTPTTADNKALGDLAELDGRVLSLKKPLTEGSLYVELGGWSDKAEDARVTVENAKAGFGVRITGDRPLKEFHVWSIKTVFCPEPFVDVTLDPGKEMKWSHRYELFETAKKPGQ
jgi:hypothetical protein